MILSYFVFNNWNPMGEYDVEDSPTHKVRVVIGEQHQGLGRWDLPTGSWSMGDVDSKGVFTEKSLGKWSKIGNLEMTCLNGNDTYGFKIFFETDGIRIEGGRFLKKIDVSFQQSEKLISSPIIPLG